jgi:hypothetical protein
MFSFRSNKPDRVRQQQAKRILDLEAELEALKRVLAIRDAELESMSAVLARDRARTSAETSAYHRERAQNEGAK